MPMEAKEGIDFPGAERELQVIVTYVTRMLGAKPGSSARALSLGARARAQRQEHGLLLQRKQV